MPPLLALYRRLVRWPGGHWLFSRAICLKAPYFATIAPRITLLEPGRCEARFGQRRRVQNHIGTVHAIALCNLAELVAGVMVDATLPATMRWIPKGMQVAYLKKATGTMHAVAVPASPLRASETGYELPVEVEIHDDAGVTVFTAQVMLWVSPRR